MTICLAVDGGAFCLAIPETLHYRAELISHRESGELLPGERAMGTGKPQDSNWLWSRESLTSSLASVWVNVTALPLPAALLCVKGRAAGMGKERISVPLLLYLHE